jgi:hypothetical protein
MSRKYRFIPDEIEKPGEVFLRDKGWSILEISEASEKTEKEIISIILEYYSKNSKKLIEAIAEMNVKKALRFLNIKTQRYQ